MQNCISTWKHFTTFEAIQYAVKTASAQNNKKCLIDMPQKETCCKGVPEIHLNNNLIMPWIEIEDRCYIWTGG